MWGTCGEDNSIGKLFLMLKILNILTPAQKKNDEKEITYISTIFKLQDSILLSTDTRDS